MMRIVCVAALAVGCVAVENGGAPDPSGTLAEPVFRCNVEPILIRDCSYTACHGNAGFALRVYSPGKLRARRPANIDEAIAALTPAERHANFTSAAAFAFGGVAADDNLLLRKTIPSPDGGFEHQGGAVFAGPDDPAYLAIRAWLSGTGACK
jgi:hypothetical protein